MNKDLTELVFVLDRSGSMADRVTDVIGGFNSLIEQQRKEPGLANVSLVIFDTAIDTLADGVDIRLFAPLTQATYFARGGTSLLDAVARATDMVGRRLGSTPEEQRPGKVLVTVMTDGQENSSTEYAGPAGAERLKAKIEHQKTKYLWQYVFVGANGDAILAGASLSVGAAQSMNFASSKAGVVGTFNVLRNYASSYRVSSGDEARSLAFSDEDRAVSMVEDVDASTLPGVGVPPAKP